MRKDLSEKLNQKFESKSAWDGAEYAKYKEQVESARIDTILGLISEFNNWATLSDEEEDQLYKIMEDLENYVKLLYKINAELNSYLEYLGE